MIYYTNLNYISNTKNKRIIRRWRSNNFSFSKAKYGWMPPHPATFIKKKLFNEFGLYENKFEISADYDLLTRILTKKDFSWLPQQSLSANANGGKSNKSIRNIYQKMVEDYSELNKIKLAGFIL